MNKNYEEGYADGIAGRENMVKSPHYIDGWEAGNTERHRKVAEPELPLEDTSK